MTQAVMRQRSITMPEAVGGAIILSVAGAIGLSLFFPPSVEVAPAIAGWNLDKAADQAMNVANTPKQNGLQIPGLPNVQLPQIQMPQFNLGQVPTLGMPQSRGFHYEWQVSSDPCQSGELGNNWDGADGMFHCLVRTEN